MVLILDGCARPVPVETRFSPQELKADLSEFFEYLKQLHPGVYRHTSLQALQKKVNQLMTVLDRPKGEWEFYRLLAELRTEVRCGHTRIFPDDGMRDEFEKQGQFFPLPVKFAMHTMFAKISEESMSEVVAINGASTEQVLSTIFSRMAVDGGADESKYEVIESKFWWYYAMYVDHLPNRFVLTLKDENGKEQRKSLMAIARTEAAKLTFNAKSSDEPIAFNMIGEVGYLVVRTFHAPDFGESFSYKEVLNQSFNQLRKDKVKKLIVDIRRNGGGDDQYGALLYSHLARAPFTYFKTVKTKENGTFVSVDHPCLARQAPTSNAFMGEAILLVDGVTFSTAADVASVFKSNSRGLIVGRETSGGYEGNTSGRSETVTLTNTGIRLTIPLWYYENEISFPDPNHRGVIPDVVTKKTFESIRSNDDVEMDYVLRR